MPPENDTAAQAKVVAPVVEDDFDSVFAEITKDAPPQDADDAAKGDSKTDTDTAADTAKADAEKSNDGDAKGDADDAGKATGDAGGGSGADKAGGDGGDSAASGDAAVTDDKKTDEEDPRDKELRELRAQLAAKAAPEKDDKGAAAEGDDDAAAADTTPEVKPFEFEAKDKEFLDSYEKEWPDIHKAEALLRKRDMYNLAGYMFKEIHKAYAPVLERLLRQGDQTAQETTVGYITRAHSDYSDELVEKATAWANGLTGFKKKAALQVIESGEPDDVIELITEYKQATGQGKPKVVVDNSDNKPAAQATPGKTNVPLSDKAKAVAATIGAQDGKRSAAAADTPDKSDFDEAWNTATAAQK